MPKPKLTTVECDWLLHLINKDIAENTELLRGHLDVSPALFQLRIENMRHLKGVLEDMKKSIVLGGRARTDTPRDRR